MKTNTKIIAGTLVVLLLCAMLLLCVGCNSYGGIYENISKEEHEALMRGAGFQGFTHELTYSWKSLDTKATDGVKSVQINYLRKLTNLTGKPDPHYYEYAVDEHIVVKFTTTDARYTAEYWFVTSETPDGYPYFYAKLTSGSKSVRIRLKSADVNGWNYSYLGTRWHDVWEKCSTCVNYIARRQLDDMRLDIHRAIITDKSGNHIGKSGDNYKIIWDNYGTLEYYRFTLDGLLITKARCESTNPVTRTVREIKQSDKSVKLPSWINDERIVEEE